MANLYERDQPIPEAEIPALQDPLANLQGNILQGHGRDHAVHVFLRFKPGQQSAVAQWIRGVAPDITSAQQQYKEIQQYRLDHTPGRLFMSLLLSAKGYEYFGLRFPDPTPPSPVFPGEDNNVFRWGMKKTVPYLGDPDSTHWEAGYQHDFHALLILADATRPDHHTFLIGVEPHIKSSTVEYGTVMRNDQGKSIEHFGYVDGISQSLFFESDIEHAFQKAGKVGSRDPGVSPNLVLVPDPYGRKDATNNQCLDSGSFMVFRKLEQNVDAFKAYEDQSAKGLGLTGAATRLAEARIMGRFRDGTPLHRTALSVVHNDFTFKDDAQGNYCPFNAHIRKVNPRDDSINNRKRRIVRRGITYGTWDKGAQGSSGDVPTEGVGLFFMCYQRNIKEQFMFLQHTWANNPDHPKKGAGRDQVIGQSGNPTPGDLVKFKGGEYFFAPSIHFLKNLGN